MNVREQFEFAARLYRKLGATSIVASGISLSGFSADAHVALPQVFTPSVGSEACWVSKVVVENRPGLDIERLSIKDDHKNVLIPRDYKANPNLAQPQKSSDGTGMVTMSLAGLSGAEQNALMQQAGKRIFVGIQFQDGSGRSETYDWPVYVAATPCPPNLNSKGAIARNQAPKTIVTPVQVVTNPPGAAMPKPSKIVRAGIITKDDPAGKANLSRR